MGFFKEKKIRGEKKYYWVVTKRDSKKLGGTGKVKTIEFYLGDSLLDLKYLSWYLWNNDIKIQDVINKLVRYHFRYYWIEEEVTFHIKQGKVYFEKIKSNTDIDLRQKIYKDLRQTIQDEITKIKNSLKYFEDTIQLIINDFKEYNKCIKYAHQDRKTDTDKYFKWCHYADNEFNYANNKLKNLLDKVPKTQRDIANDQIWGYCLRECPLEKLDL